MENNQNIDVTIYKLISPIDNSVKYVGQTRYPLNKRLGGHLTDARRNVQNYRTRWLKSIMNKGLIPIIEEIEKVSYDERNERERYWISYYGRENLINGTDGGECSEGYVCSDESRAKMSESHLGQIPWNKGISADTTHLEKFQFKKGHDVWNKGISCPIEVREKVSKSKSGKATGKRSGSKNKCLGVHNPKENLWIAHIGFMSKQYSVGRYPTEKDAGMAYDICSLWFSENDRILNFPENKDEYTLLLSNNKIENLKELRVLIKRFLIKMED
jgi:hypothetical protein